MSDPGHRVALVSGAARPPGIGRATALRLAASGYAVACSDLVADRPADTATVREEDLARVVAEVAAVPGAGRVIALPYPDHRAADAGAWEDAVAATVREFGGPDACCVLNGVTGPRSGDGPLVALSDEAWRRNLDVNLTAAWMLVRASACSMIDSGTAGSIVMLSSQASLLAKAEVGAVGLARAAINHMVATLAKELGPHRVRVNAVAPLAVSPSAEFPNPGLVALAEREGTTLDAWLGRHIPLGRPQTADETAAVVEFLCSEAASFVSGVTLPVHGGAQP